MIRDWAAHTLWPRICPFVTDGLYETLILILVLANAWIVFLIVRFLEHIGAPEEMLLAGEFGHNLILFFAVARLTVFLGKSLISYTLKP